MCCCGPISAYLGKHWGESLGPQSLFVFRINVPCDPPEIRLQGDWKGLLSYINLSQSMYIIILYTVYCILLALVFESIFSRKYRKHDFFKPSKPIWWMCQTSLRNPPMQSQRNFSAAKKTLAGLGCWKKPTAFFRSVSHNFVVQLTWNRAIWIRIDSSQFKFPPNKIWFF